MVFTIKAVIGPSTAIPVEGVLCEAKIHEEPWSNPMDSEYTNAEGYAYLDVISGRFYDLSFTKEGFRTYVDYKNVYIVDGGSMLLPLEQVEIPPNGNGDEIPPPISPLFPLIPLMVAGFFLIVRKG